MRHTEPSASAQFLDFLELAENCTFLDRKLIHAINLRARIPPFGEGGPGGISCQRFKIPLFQRWTVAMVQSFQRARLPVLKVFIMKRAGPLGRADSAKPRARPVWVKSLAP